MPPFGLDAASILKIKCADPMAYTLMILPAESQITVLCKWIENSLR